MKVEFLSEDKAIISESNADRETPYNVEDVIAGALGIKTAKDFICFLLDTPFSFFARVSHQMIGFEVTYEYVSESNDDQRDFRKRPYNGSILDAINNPLFDIEPIDRCLLLDGTLGLLREHEFQCGDGEKFTREVIDFNGKYRMLNLGTIEMFVQNIRTLATLSAIANGAPHPGWLKRIPLEDADSFQLISSELLVLTDFNKLPVQSPSPDELFTKEYYASVLACLESNGYTVNDGRRRIVQEGRSRNEGELFLYPSSWSDKDIAGNIFESFINSLFEGESAAYYAGNTYKVRYGSEGFSVVGTKSPFRELYLGVAKYAAANSFRLCACCGNPILVEKSRGNVAMYCSRSCNTKASNSRREVAYALAASGAPIEEAISKLGDRYANSIKRWYADAETLIGKPHLPNRVY